MQLNSLLEEKLKMYIREDYVTNSSSTSYVIISDEEINAEDLVKYLGLTKENPLYDGFYDACERIIETRYDGLYHYSYLDSFNKNVLTETFGEKTANKVMKAYEENKKVYFGTISTEYDDYEACLAMDYFSINDDAFFIDATSCIY